jgi:cbb3-type cytochrome oxidase subunit 1
MTFVLLVPILTAASNLFATARGRWELIGQAYGLRFAATGLGLLVVWAVGTAVSTLPQVSRIVGLTAWGAGLRHLLWWGVISSFGFALIYRIWPLCVGRAWQSTSLQSFHFWGTMTGVGLGWFTLAASGVFQGTLAQAWARLGAEQGFDEMVQFGVMAQRWFQAGTLLAFAILAAAQYALVYNAFRTARVGPPVVVLAAPAATGIRA